MTGTVAIIGGGVIGGGWAARFLLNGWTVRVFDPDPRAGRKVSEMLDNARRSMPGLSDVALPPEGELQMAEHLTDAVQGADWIQESVPERLDLKHETLARIQADCDPSSIIGSSTSGFRPSQLQTGALRPEQIIVCHPFNPVYLLPLVEVVASPAKNAPRRARACGILSGLGMYPLLVRKEIDAHIADRLLEAVRRESLWLVRDGIATTEDIDNAIRYGFGLRWAQMGLFETYRIAGGEAGMRHFLQQFGPALKWPWTRLTDVPDLDAELVDLIATQSDAQSGATPIRALERRRDDALVAILRALKAQGHGAGALLNAHDIAVRGAVSPPPDTSESVSVTADRAVPDDWSDPCGYVTEPRLLQAFSDATARFLQLAGCAALSAADMGFVTRETCLCLLQDLKAGSHIEIRTRTLGCCGHDLRLWHDMLCDDTLIATVEHVLVHMDFETREPCAPAPGVIAALRSSITVQADLPPPDGAGRRADVER